MTIYGFKRFFKAAFNYYSPKIIVQPHNYKNFSPVKTWGVHKDFGKIKAWGYNKDFAGKKDFGFHKFSGKNTWSWDSKKNWYEKSGKYAAHNDTAYGTDENDDISTGIGNDIIIAKNGNDILDGESGRDIMIGGKGDDTYYVDNAYDKAIEKSNEGNDTVLSSISVTAPENIEHISLLTDNDINATGNSLNNVLHGNDGHNHLKSLDGNDNLYGHAGNDILKGGKGDDFLNGGAGCDILNGGEGCDTYVFDRGYSHDVIYDYDSGSAHEDILQFNGNIDFSDLSFERLGNSLLINIADGSPTSDDSVTIHNWFKGSEYQIEKFVFAESNVSWDSKQISDAVQEQIQAQMQIIC